MKVLLTLYDKNKSTGCMSFGIVCVSVRVCECLLFLTWVKSVFHLINYYKFTVVYLLRALKLITRTFTSSPAREPSSAYQKSGGFSPGTKVFAYV